MALLQLLSSKCRHPQTVGHYTEYKLMAYALAVSSMLTCESHELSADQSLDINFAGGKAFVCTTPIHMLDALALTVPPITGVFRDGRCNR